MIETPRLLLRPYALDDFEAYAALVVDPAVTRLFGGQPMSREDAWNRLLRYAGHWALLGYGMFAIFERGSGRHVGETGLLDFGRGLGDGFDPYPEAAWLLGGASHGRGYATEAAEAVHAWFAGIHGAGRTVCIIERGNDSSLKVADKLGYQPFDETVYRDKSFVMLERTTV
ncbi:acetyltransferase [Aureimonas sp. Leaf454]|uniref:GNAT family N-acetyltransferase n=1 Tax=Aureimonas sp. Leaf454 TaxID=1736381 RepID=UPI0006F2F5DB|nr:GNAT family N-acetyltransferase [Aureimonas sp. Leaf454]KQT47473.1 acetyltransferase [Aureimonas sp. Leaf454]